MRENSERCVRCLSVSVDSTLTASTDEGCWCILEHAEKQQSCLSLFVFKEILCSICENSVSKY